ncbi:MAG: DUF6263 family protein [Desulfobacterales bacterium]|nr:DUF6263 family protein [Desulfobacterales bacterium]
MVGIFSVTKAQRAFSIILASAIVFGLVSLSSASDEKIQLGFHPQSGKSYNLKQITDQYICQTIQGQQQKMGSKIGVKATCDVLGVEADGTARMKITYRGFLIKQTGPTGTIDYNSSRSTIPEDPISKIYSSLIGQSITFQMSPQGQVKNIQGLDNILSMVMAQSNVPQGPERASVEKMVVGIFGEEGLGKMMQKVAGIFPDVPVGIGDTWTKESHISDIFPAIIKSKYTLKDRQNGVATVEVQSTVEPNPNAQPKPMDFGSATLSYEVTGTTEGVIQIEEASGWTISGKYTQKMSGMAKMQDSAQPSRNMSIPITVESTTTLEPF